MLPAEGRVQDDASEPEPDALASGWVTPPGGTKVDALFVLAGSSLGIGRTERVTSPVWLNLEELVTLDAIGDSVDGVTEVELSMEDGTTIGAGWTDAFCSSVVDALTAIAEARSGAPTLDAPVVDAPVVDAPLVEAPLLEAPADGSPASGTEDSTVDSGTDGSRAGDIPTFGLGAPSSAESLGTVAEPAPQAAVVDDVATDGPDVRFDEVAAPQSAPSRQAAPSRSASLELEDVVYIGGYPGQSKRRKKCTTTLTRAGLELSGPGDLSFRISWDVVKTLEVQNSDEARFRMNTKIHRDASALVVECDQGVTILLEARDCPTVALRSAIGQLMVDLPVVVV